MRPLRSNTPGLGVGRVINLTPPMDWRMAATVAVSSGISDSQSALAAGQASKASKSRPSFTVASSGTEYIEYTVSESGQALLSWLGQNSGTATVTLNGVDQSFSPRFPTGGSVSGSAAMMTAGGRRQFMKLTVQANDVIRLTIAAGASTRTVLPLLHRIPETGPWEAYVIFGASRESDGLTCKLIEDDVIADDATRDPVVFSHALSGADLADIVPLVDEAAPLYVGVAPYSILGNVLGNTITAQRPYDASEATAINANLAAIAADLASFTVLPCSTSYRQYPGAPAVTPSDQSGGSLVYNDNVLFPAIASNFPGMYDAALARPRIDSYLAILRARASLNADGIHDAYPQERAEWVRTAFKRVKNGSWAGISSQAEVRVSAAEANSTVKANALTEYTEATYTMLALAASGEKAALQARLDVIYPTALFYEAVRLIDAAEITLSQSDKDIAQTALNAASAAGYAGATSPNTIAAQQARIDAIVVISFDQTIKIGFGSATAVSTWNRTNSISTTGVIIADLLNDAGASTGVGLNVTTAASINSTNSGLTSAVSDVPSAILTNTWTLAGNIAYKLTGLDPAKTYDVLLMASRSGASDGRLVTYSINGVTQSPVIDPMGNVNNFVLATNVSPNGSGEISVVATRTGSFGHHTAMIVKRRA